MLAAIRQRVPDRIPVDCICVENGPALADHLGCPEEEVLERLGLDGRGIGPAYLGDPPRCPSTPPLPSPERREGRGERGQGGQASPPLDEWGGINTGDYGTAHHYPLAAADSVAEVERYPWPDPARYDYATAAQQAAALRDYAVRGPHWQPLLCRVAALMGLEQTLLKLALRPEVFDAALEEVTSRVEEHCRLLIEACGEAMPILKIGDDFATQRGLMFSPEQWRRFLKPRYARLFALGKQAGLVVWFHSCGDITPVLPDLIEIGMDVWETVQLHTLPLSPQELKRQYGRDLCFFGGVNTQRLPFVTPEQVREETRRCLETLGEGGGYICGPDHHLKPDVPGANAVALFETARSFRHPGYTLLP